MGKRKVTLVTCQWSDLDFETLCKTAKKMGYDGLELATWGNAFDLDKAYEDDGYIDFIKKTLKKYDLMLSALATHIIGQCVSDLPDPRLNNFAPARLADKPDEIKKWGIESMKKAAVVARKLGVKTVSGFTGSPIWRYLYSFPQTPESMIEAGFKKVHDEWAPILDVFRKNGVRFALEVHPSEIAFDYYTTKRILETFKDYPEFGINFDPSHLIWQGINPALFLDDFADHIYNLHMKDAKVSLDGRTGLLGSHIDFGSLKRGWNFRSLGHGDVNFEEIIRVLNAHNINLPLAVEWEDSGMERIAGGTEACAFIRRVDFEPSNVKFDDAIANK
jgi:sugar phosphate isomerase/epimerase